MSYEILEHTADVKFKAEADELEKAFEDSIRAFSKISSGGITGSVRHYIEVESENLEALVFDFMDELIFLQETENVMVGEPENLELEDLEDKWVLKTTVYTDPIDEGASIMDIKAPTYNEMNVDYQDGCWIIEAVLDV